jgi:hypothetical protein
MNFMLVIIRFPIFILLLTSYCHDWRTSWGLIADGSKKNICYVFWVLMACSSRKDQCFRGIYLLWLQRWRLTKASFDPEDGGDIFHRNFRLFPNYMTLECKKKPTLHICCGKNLRLNIVMPKALANNTNHYYITIYSILSRVYLKF